MLTHYTEDNESKNKSDENQETKISNVEGKDALEITLQCADQQSSSTTVDVLNLKR